VTNTLRVYTDGSVGPTNPGPGGWGVYACWSGDEADPVFGCLGGTHGAATTNNRMELEGLLQGLHALLDWLAAGGRSFTPQVQLVSDSQYALGYLAKALRGAPVRANPDYQAPLQAAWQAVSVALAGCPRPRAVWVRGHAGTPGNEAADGLARSARGP
jgi:ribonuclease HI